MKTESICHDPFGFPMIRIPEMRVFVHCLPVTKIQFEHFLCDATDGHFDARWYETVLRLNPRTTARRIWRGNYWNAFLSGILPAEVERFAAWCGEGYRLLTADEWQCFFKALKLRDIQNLTDLGILKALGPRQGELIERVEQSVEKVCAERKEPCELETRMLLRLGLVEWVSATDREDHLWGGMGEPYPSFCGNLFVPERGELILPRDPESRRQPSFGFRLAFDPTLVQNTVAA